MRRSWVAIGVSLISLVGAAAAMIRWWGIYRWEPDPLEGNTTETGLDRHPEGENPVVEALTPPRMPHRT